MSEIAIPTNTDASYVESQLMAVSGAATQIMSTIKGDDFESRMQVTDAVLNAVSLQENMLDKPFNLTNWVAQVVTVNPDDPDEDVQLDANGRVKALRLVLIDDKGNAYHTLAEGVASALGTIVAALGEPHTWKRPITVVAKRVKSRGARFILTLKIVTK